jgi:hypothetical protein
MAVIDSYKVFVFRRGSSEFMHVRHTVLNASSFKVIELQLDMCRVLIAL